MFRRWGAFVALISVGLQQVSPLCSPLWALPIESDRDLSPAARSLPSALVPQDSETPLMSGSVTGISVSESFLAFDLESKTARLYSRDGELLQPNLSCSTFPWDQPADKLAAFLPTCWFSVQDGAFEFYGRLLGGMDSFGDPCRVDFGGGNYGGDWSAGITFSNNSSAHTSGSSGSTYIPLVPAVTPQSTPAAPRPAPAKVAATPAAPPSNPPTLSQAHKHPEAPRCVAFTPKHTPEPHLLAHLMHNPYYAAAGHTVTSGKGGKSHEVAGMPAAAWLPPSQPSQPVVAPVVPKASPPQIQKLPVFWEGSPPPEKAWFQSVSRMLKKNYPDKACTIDDALNHNQAFLNGWFSTGCSPRLTVTSPHLLKRLGLFVPPPLETDCFHHMATQLKQHNPEREAEITALFAQERTVQEIQRIAENALLRDPEKLLENGSVIRVLGLSDFYIPGVEREKQKYATFFSALQGAYPNRDFSTLEKTHGTYIKVRLQYVTDPLSLITDPLDLKYLGLDPLPQHPPAPLPLSQTAFEEHIASKLAPSSPEPDVETSLAALFQEDRPSSPPRIEDTNYEVTKGWIAERIPDPVKESVQAVFSRTLEGLDLVTFGSTSLTLEHLHQGFATCGSYSRKGLRFCGVPQRTAQNIVDWLDVAIMVTPTRAGVTAVSTVARIAKASTVELKLAAKIATAKPALPRIAPKPANTSVKQCSAIQWMDEGASMNQVARGYNDSALGARSNVLTKKTQAPSLPLKKQDGIVKWTRFDGVDGKVMIDRKVAIVTTEKAKQQAYVNLKL